MNFFLAKSSGITLYQHSVDVVKKTEEILRQFGVKDELIINLAKVSASVHDCGKTCAIFQKYLNENIDIPDDFPRHSEIGFGLIELLGINRSNSIDNNTFKLIKYTTLFHHNPFNYEKDLEDLYSVDELRYISKYYNDIFSVCGIDDIISFNEDISEEQFEDKGIVIGKVNTFDLIKNLDRGDSLSLLEKFELIFNVVRYADYIVSNNDELNLVRVNSNITNLNLNLPSHFDKERWIEQCDVADKAFENNITLVSATMGWGKTICGANFLLHSEKRGYWICPDNSLARTTYYNLVNTLKECGVKDVRILLLLSGNWEECNWESDNIKLNDVDIIVTNIDTYVNGITRNTRKELSFDCLFSNCIFDEYHEYAFTNAPLLARFKTVINARKKIGNVKTLLLSGTAVNNGYVNVDNVIEAGINLEKEKRVNIKFITADEYYSNFLNTPNSVHIHTRVQSCQNGFEDGDMDLCFHSIFDNNTSKNIIDYIISHNGRFSTCESKNLSSTSVCSRGMDVSFAVAFLINPTPHMIEQILGRTGNRWDFSVVGTLYIVEDNRNTELFIYKELNAWDKYYYPYIKHLKTKVNNEPISLYDLRRIRTDFFENNKDKNISYKKFIKSNISRSLDLLSQIVFSKGNGIKKDSNNVTHIKDGVEVRGDTTNRFFIFQKDGQPFGNVSGPINIPHYFFGSDGFNTLLHNKEIISNTIKYFEKNKTEREKYAIKDIKRWKHTNLFNHLIKLSKCSETPFPILCDYGFNEKKGGYKKKIK